jgi:hypothetical protein
MRLKDYEQFKTPLPCAGGDLSDINKMVRTDDGVLYIPFVLEDEINANTGAVVRRDWLDKLNLASPDRRRLVSALSGFKKPAERARPSYL